MKVHVEFIPSRKRKMLKFRNLATGMDLIECLDLNPDAFILVREGKPIPIDEQLKNGDRIKLISVASGG